jgi:hypothetical protein
VAFCRRAAAEVRTWPRWKRSLLGLHSYDRTQDADDDPPRARMTTWPGRHTIDLLDPDPATIDIRDIAHHLAYQRRYLGATSRPISTAEHGVFVSRHCDPEHALEGLLHDGSEAYTGDLISPLKHLVGMELYRRIEAGLERAIAARFHLMWPWPPDVKAADHLAYDTERFHLKGTGAGTGLELIGPLSDTEAEALFLERFRELERVA